MTIKIAITALASYLLLSFLIFKVIFNKENDKRDKSFDLVSYFIIFIISPLIGGMFVLLTVGALILDSDQ